MKKKIVTIFLILAILVVAILGSLYFIYKNKDDSTTLLLLDTKNNYIELVIPVVGIVALAALFTIIAMDAKI